jgi:uncharacterized membrane protein
MEKYGARYLVVSGHERGTYKVQEAQFDGLFPLAFHGPTMKIYDVKGQY